LPRSTADLARLAEEVRELKARRNAVILSHLYQRPEIQDLADYVGDSLGLSQNAARTQAEVIVFCGVHFMAESAAILCPDRIVLLPEEDAGCPMADMITAEDLRRRKAELGDVTVVCYINSSAEVKAESDICCTSANAVKVVGRIPPDRRILFVPDRHLGHYVARKTGRELILWEGYCPTHDRLTAGEVLAAKRAHPGAVVMVHPECRPEVIDLADVVASTSGMLRHARESEARDFIVGTETGILYQLQKQCPGKRFYPASQKMVCPNMKATTLDKVKRALETLEPRITVPPDVRARALASLERMLQIT